MVAGAVSRVARPLWRIRWVEWGVMALCIAVVMAVLWRYGEQVREQSERAAVQGTLGALRTALVLDHLHSSVPGARTPASSPAGPQAVPNPFALLQQAAVNYAGEMPAARMHEVRPGNWVFDRRCGCVGYKPQDAGVLQAPAGAQALWFLVDAGGGAPQLKPLQTYLWAGFPIE